MEAAAGIESKATTSYDYYGATRSRALVARAAVDWELDSHIGMRAMAWWIQHGAGDGQNVTSSRLAALTASVDFLLNVEPGKFAIVPSVGLGFAPWIRSTYSYPSYAADGTPQQESSTVASSGKVWVIGIAARFRHVVIEQSLVGLVGDQGVFASQSTYYPLMVGVRF